MHAIIFIATNLARHFRRVDVRQVSADGFITMNVRYVGDSCLCPKFFGMDRRPIY